ncbi:single-stranded DNA-binding protein [Variovorax sp. ZS18.2.2]|uniref:single-stranded DNA-binding protein n=1 Tax=Variovorax sp. ZS18.2.2 TaxID=2971255 RepID=UPI0021513582|nr:single-stranded DNA-binding protein [Variovorax sp. ZS18.2.2]MCR6480961.1 single-stranded DNA-binding protein [Variovorax sp. ZS18.2.2]
MRSLPSFQTLMQAVRRHPHNIRAMRGPRTLFEPRIPQARNWCSQAPRFNPRTVELHNMQNLFIGKGNLADAPTLKRVAGRNGDFDVANMRVMFGRYGQNADGDIEQTGGFWREVEIYGQKAKDVARLLRKGARVLVIGEEREFTAHDEDQNEVEVIKVVAEDVALQLSRVENITFSQPRARQESAEQDA